MAAGTLDVTSGGKTSPHRWWMPLRHLLSFECAFAIFLYSNQLKGFLKWTPKLEPIILKALPADETALFAGLSGLAGLWIILRRGVYLRGLAIVAAGLVFIGWVTLTYAWTPSRSFAKQHLMFLWAFDLWCLIAGAMILAQDRERYTRFLLFVVGIGALFVISGYEVVLSHGTFRGWIGWYRMGFPGAYLVWGYTVADAAAILLALTLFSRLGTVKHAISASLFLLYVGFVLLSGARGPLLMLAMVLLVGFYADPPTMARGLLRIPHSQFVLLLLALGGVSVIIYALASGMQLTVIRRLMDALADFEGQRVVRGANRAIYWPAAVKFWLQAPFLGNGVSSFSVLLRGAEIPGTYPHNVFLQILAENGLIGLLLLGLPMWVGLRNFFVERLRSDHLYGTALIMFVVAIMNSMFTKDLAHAYKMFLGIGLLALAPRPPAPAPATAALPTTVYASAASLPHLPRPRGSVRH